MLGRSHRWQTVRRRHRLRDPSAPAYIRELPMDLNQLYSSQQLALMGAETARHPEARRAHLARADQFSTRIEVVRRAMGAVVGARG